MKLLIIKLVEADLIWLNIEKSLANRTLQKKILMEKFGILPNRPLRRLVVCLQITPFVINDDKNIALIC